MAAKAFERHIGELLVVTEYKLFLCAKSGERAEVEVPDGDKLGMLYTVEGGKVSTKMGVEAREVGVTQVLFVADKF